MKRLKPLIQIELRKSIPMSFYFIVVGIISLVSMIQSTKYIFQSELTQGISSLAWYMYGRVDWGNLFRENIARYVIAMIVGLVFMIYLSYRNDKNHEVCRFLKSLPYTMKERYLVKIGTGMATFTIAYVLYSVGMVIFRNSFVSQAKEIYEVTIFSEIFDQIFSMNQLIQILFVVYTALIACYLFGVMFEYLVSHNFASVLIAVLVGLSPAFILLNLSLYVEGDNPILNKIAWICSKILLGEGGWKYVHIDGAMDHSLVHYEYVDYVGMKIGVYLIIAGICFITTLNFCKKSYLENMDVFIPGKIFRKVFIMGVTVCAGLLLGDLYYVFAETQDIMLYIANGIGAIIGLIVAWKLAHIGTCKSEKRANKEVY